MLTYFKVKGFKNFKEEVELNLEDIRNYEFNENAIKDGVIKTAIMYGKNGSGKSNLGYAMFDIITHITDKYISDAYDENYLNLDTKEEAKFTYRFKFDDNYLEYQYSKLDKQTLIEEEIKINGETYIKYNHFTGESILRLIGTETLNTNLKSTKISFIKYISNNTVLELNTEGVVFLKFISFVDSMLFFRSLKMNEYQGFTNDTENIDQSIIKKGKLKEFENFLRKNGIYYNLVARELSNGKSAIYCKFEKEEVNFFEISSSGTSSLALFYYWLLRLDDVSLVFIDEFDAFYHSSVSKSVVKEILELKNTQCIFTTHNTDIMTNDLLRPDCYFEIEQGQIKNFSNSTDKELRKAHNLQKMYKAGAFSNE